MFSATIGGDQRIEDVPAGHDGEHEADDHPDRRDDVGDRVLTVGNERRRAPGFAPIDQRPGPNAVYDRGDDVERDAEAGMIELHA